MRQALLPLRLGRGAAARLKCSQRQPLKAAAGRGEPPVALHQQVCKVGGGSTVRAAIAGKQPGLACAGGGMGGKTNEGQMLCLAVGLSLGGSIGAGAA